MAFKLVGPSDLCAALLPGDWGGSRPSGPHCPGPLCSFSLQSPRPEAHRHHLNSVSSVQSLSHVWVSANLWTVARQGSLFITNYWSLGKLMSIELVIPSNHLTLCHPLSSCLQSCPVTGSFLMSQFFTSVGPKYWRFNFSIGPSNEYSGLISFRMTVRISLQSKGLSRVLCNTTVQNHQFFIAHHSLWSQYHFHTWQ